MINYTNLKFNTNKSYLYFPGITIIHHITDQILKEFLSLVHTEYENSGVFKNTTFLPEESYHMTVADLITYKTIQIDAKFKDIPFKNLTVDELDKEVVRRIGIVDFDFENIEMEIDSFERNVVRLKPRSDEMKKRLQSFREEIFNAIGLKVEPDYYFHISLSYTIGELDSQEEQVINKFLVEMNCKYKPIFPKMKVDGASICVFNDMSEFKNYNLGRCSLSHQYSEVTSK